MRAWQSGVRCDERTCHGNSCGLCLVLSEKIEGKPCPFYKTALKLAKEIDAIRANDWAAYHDIEKTMK